MSGLLLLLALGLLLFTGVGRRWTGRGAGWLLWHAPKSAAKYTWDSNMALAGDIGRRVAIFVVYGVYVWGARWAWLRLDLPKPGLVVIDVLLLLWFLYLANLVSFIRHARAQASRNRQLAREQYRVLHEIRSDVRGALAGVGQRVSEGGVDVLGIFRTDDPIRNEQQRTSRQQQREARDMLPEEQRNMPLGDRNEPVFPMPRWLRRRGPR